MKKKSLYPLQEVTESAKILNQLWRESNSYDSLMLKRIMFRRKIILLREDLDNNSRRKFLRMFWHKKGLSGQEIDDKLAKRETQLKKCEKELEKLVVRTRKMRRFQEKVIQDGYFAKVIPSTPPA